MSVFEETVIPCKIIACLILCSTSLGYLSEQHYHYNCKQDIKAHT